MYTLPEIGPELLDRSPVGAVGTPVTVEAFESIRLSIWATANEAPPKASTEVSAITVATVDPAAEAKGRCPDESELKTAIHLASYASIKGATAVAERSTFCSVPRISRM
jgi:hypothetical protein